MKPADELAKDLFLMPESKAIPLIEADRLQAKREAYEDARNASCCWCKEGIQVERGHVGVLRDQETWMHRGGHVRETWQCFAAPIRDLLAALDAEPETED